MASINSEGVPSDMGNDTWVTNAVGEVHHLDPSMLEDDKQDDAEDTTPDAEDTTPDAEDDDKGGEDVSPGTSSSASSTRRAPSTSKTKAKS